MEKVLVFLLSLTLLACGNQSSKSKSNVAETQDEFSKFEQKLKADLDDLQSQLPSEIYDGAWIWSAKYSDKTLHFVMKFNSYIAGFMDNNAARMDEIKKQMVKLLEDDAQKLADNGCSLILEFRSFEDNSFLLSAEILPEDIAQYIKELEASASVDVGNRSLSYYKNGFESDNANLPIRIDEITTYFRVSMPENIVYYDYYMDDDYLDIVLTDDEISRDFKTEIKQNFISRMRELMIVPETRQDMKTYQIKFCIRYYFRSSKKLGTSIMIDPVTEIL